MSASMPTGTSPSSSHLRQASGANRGMRLAVLAAALLLAACSRTPLSHLPSFSAAKAPPAPSEEHPNADADLVSAVGAGNEPTPISVKFRLGKKPQLGVPLQILIAIIPAPDAQIAHLHGSFLPDTGLSLQGDRTMDVTDLRAGEPLERQLSVVPTQPGVLNLNATFTLDQDTGSVTRSYAIPIIVSDNSS